MEHTPTLWSNKGPYIKSPVGKGNETIAQTFHVMGEDRGMSVRNADFIVRAVNSHEMLVKALDDVLRWSYNLGLSYDHPASQSAREALAAAGEQS